ncbi:glutamate racemase [Patescibacteria group bacterium]|nr:glutamate racemase [Patescibacteria group bacterium]
MLKKSPIGIFDSGFGGLEVFREIVKLLPEYDYIYLGDTARAPYGARAQAEIYKFTEQAVDFLFKQDCALIISACNTASSEALRKIQQNYLIKNYPDKRVLGVVIPAAESAAELTKNKKIGVIATQGTVASESFIRELKKIDKNIEVYQMACPLLVPLIETGKENSKEMELALEECLKPLIEKHIDTLILGCTHYGLLSDKIRDITGKGIKIVSEGKIVAEKLKDYLKRHREIEEKISKNSLIEFLTTDLTEKFQKLGSVFFGCEIEVKKVDI